MVVPLRKRRETLVGEAAMTGLNLWGARGHWGGEEGNTCRAVCADAAAPPHLNVQVVFV